MMRVVVTTKRKKEIKKPPRNPPSPCANPQTKRKNPSWIRLKVKI